MHGTTEDVIIFDYYGTLHTHYHLLRNRFIEDIILEILGIKTMNCDVSRGEFNLGVRSILLRNLGSDLRQRQKNQLHYNNITIYLSCLATNDNC